MCNTALRIWSGRQRGSDEAEEAGHSRPLEPRWLRTLTHTHSSEDTHTAPVNPQRRPLADRSSGAELSDGRPTARFITWGRCFPETWKSLRTSSRDSARAPARGGQTTTSDRKASARLQIRVPRKGTLICRRGTRSQNGLRQASKILLGSRSGSGPYG